MYLKKQPVLLIFRGTVYDKSAVCSKRKEKNQIFHFSQNTDGPELLYLQVYHHYRNLITARKLLPGSRMPSLRKCSQELQLSRTTVENAYLQLAAEGYIISKAQSGYYVTDIATKEPLPRQTEKPSLPPCRYDLSSSGVDRESFRFDLWQRYLKSALRQNQRLLTYGEPQGEADFRQALSDYVYQKRNIACSPDDIVVGAGVQSLLQILCPLIRDKKPFPFPLPLLFRAAPYSLILVSRSDTVTRTAELFMFLLPT